MMFTFMKSNKVEKPIEIDSINDGLSKIYKSTLLPLEESYLFSDFHSAQLDDADFKSKPMVLLVGQYSTGKTTFIRYLLEEDYPGMHIGAEPTTDSFIAVMKGTKGITRGHTLVTDTTLPFRALGKYGNAFLKRFHSSQVDNSVLDSVSIIDTPGILSGEKQRLHRGYDFDKIMEWLAEKASLIVLLFDAHKLDISDEFRRVIKCMHGHDENIRIVLNKADMVTPQQLMRVYGALMWSLGKILNTPEVTRVYVGSFWSKPLHFDSNKRLFELEEKDLFEEIQNLPHNFAMVCLNSLIKRAKLAKVNINL